jgi:hypothetical protein
MLNKSHRLFFALEHWGLGYNTGASLVTKQTNCLSRNVTALRQRSPKGTTGRLRRATELASFLGSISALRSRTVAKKTRISWRLRGITLIRSVPKKTSSPEGRSVKIPFSGIIQDGTLVFWAKIGW